MMSLKGTQSAGSRVRVFVIVHLRLKKGSAIFRWPSTLRIIKHRDDVQVSSPGQSLFASLWLLITRLVSVPSMVITVVLVLLAVFIAALYLQVQLCTLIYATFFSRRSSGVQKWKSWFGSMLCKVSSGST